MTIADPADAWVRTDGTYRDQIVAVEPGGNEFIAEADRHRKPHQLFWTWASSNLEFATIFVGVLAIAVFGMTFWQAVLGITIGTGLGAIAHYVPSARGPLHGVPQMVLGRLAFGFKGNAGLAFFGHNLVQAFERWTFPVLAVILAVTSVVILSESHFAAAAIDGGVGGLGGFLLIVGTAFGYAAGWTPYAPDDTRYLPATVSTTRTGFYAGAGLFLSCAALEIPR